VTLFGQTANGGVFLGGTAAGNELVLTGAINGAVPGIGMSQRDGRVIYRGGGNLTGGFVVTNTAIVGATNGLPVGLSPTLGGSGNATLDLASQGAAGFDQSLVGLTFGNGTLANAFAGTVTLGARTLSLTGGDVTSISNAGQNVTHVVTATTGGINFGSAARNIVVPDTLANDDMVFDKVALGATGGLTKTGAGTLVLRNVTSTGALAVTGGTIATSTAGGPAGNAFTAAGGTGNTLTVPSLTFGTGTAVRLNVGATGGDLITATTALVNPTTAGVTFRLTQTGGVLVPNGTYDLIKYGGTSPGLAGFTIGSFGHATAALVDTGTAIAVQVTGNDRVVWDATTNGTWDVNTTANWKLQTAGTSTNYLEGDDVLFQDNPTGATAGAVTLAANVAPSNVRFNNTAATPYTVSAGTAIGITGPTGLTKDGTGTATVRLANTYTGPTAVNAGTLVLDHDVTGNVVLNAASAVSVAPGATLRLQRNDGGFTFANPISGAGLVELQPHVSTGSTTAQGIVLSGNNAGFTGTLRLLAPASATYRITSVTPAALGSATVEVQSGAQVFTAANQTYTNNITIAGTGFADSAGNIGALRLEGGSNWAGNVVINGSARIGAHSATATISGNVSGGNAEFNATNFNNSYTVILTGTNSYGTTVIGGQNTQTAGVPTMRLNVGAGGTTGTLGTGAVTINGDGANGVLGFDRSDGYTLAQTITGAGSTITRTFVDFDTLGTGFASNGNAITLGAATSGGGGTLRAGQSRANTVTTFNSAVTGENLFVGSAANNATLNVVAGATVAANAFYLGNAAGMSGTVNQTGGAVNVTGQLRVSHFGTNTSTYNLSGGTLTLTGASPTLTPSTAAAGGANATGDNNINGTATATIHGGGVYIGIDGTGIFNHTGGTLTTNWIVLDNRGDTTGGVNMPDGIDRYTLDGAANPELRLRSTWGLIARNASTAVTFGQGTVTVDNTGGTSATTGNNITVPLDATIDTVAGKTTTLNLNTSVASPSNALTFTRDVRGSGTLALTGGGTVNLSTTGTQTVSPAITAAAGGTNLNKLGAGATTLTGSLSGFAGNVTVTAGRLNLPSTALGGGNVTVADGAALAGEPSGIGTLTLGGSAGATILFDPTTARSITVTNLVVNGTTAIDVTAAPVGSGPFDVVTYANRSGAGGFSIANPSNYRTAPTVTDTGTAIQISVAAGKALTWTGSASGAWNINGAQNWVDQSATPDVFFSGDAVTFPEGGANPSVALTGLIAPASVAVTSATTNYTFTSSANNLITGTTGIAKTGASTLTLVGANTYSGTTSVGGGTVVVSAANSLGDGSATNGIALSGGGRLSTTAAIDLGTRPVSVGAGGGSLSFNNAAAGTVTVGGSLAGTGANALSFHTAAAGAGTFVLTGSNAGYAGRITVDAASTAGTTLRFASSAAVPGTGSVITLNYPAAATTSGTASGIDLPGGVTIPAGVTLNMTSFNTAGNISQRTQIVSNGDNTVAAPITVSGNSVIQFNPGTGALTLAGPVTETTAGAFTGNFFLRGASTATSVLSGTVNLPTAGASVSKTDSGTWLITSTGNVFPNAAIAVGTLRTGAAGALPANVNVTLGQNDANAATLDLNGFSQTVGSMTSNPTTVGANTTGKAVTSATAATFTINQSTATTYAGLFTGALSLVKTGSGALTLPATTSTFTGNVQVDGGSLVAAGVGSNTAGSLGNPSVAGRTVTVSAAGTLSFSSNNVFGNGVGNANLPAVVLNGGTLSGTRYNVLGDVTLNTGATLTQASTDAGGYAGFQFRGAVTVGGVSASTIATTNAKANHLAAGTVFTVADVTGSPAADLTVSAPLADQSADFASAAGGLTKAGAGTMLLTGASTYTGATTVTAGVLQVAAGGTGSLAATAVAVKAGGTLAGTGSIAGPVSVEASGVLAPGSGVATLATGSLTLAAGSTLALDVTGPNATDYDRVSVTGAVTAGGNISVTPSGTVQPTDVLTVVLNDAADAVGGSFATVNGVALVATGPNVWTTAGPDVFGNVYTVNTAGGDGNDVTITGVPEPTSAAALGLAAVGLLAGRRRRRRSAG
ncbi:MAG TPA: autotransporter-associated beta strand repeat-containing protein, partial [Humisphaera sp.]